MTDEIEWLLDSTRSLFLLNSHRAPSVYGGRL